MVTITQTTPETESTEPTAQAVLDSARARVGELEAAVAALPAAYSRAARRGRADEMKTLRHQRLDCEEELHAGRIRAVRAEMDVLQLAYVDVYAREVEAARAVEETEAAMVAARAVFDEAAAASNAAQGRASAIRWEMQHLRAQSLGAEERLVALVAAPMPD